jgi:CubicO group peptidase (beta-lactamase class C family)
VTRFSRVPSSLDFSGLDSYLTAQTADADFAGVVLVCSGDDVLFSGAYGPASRRWPVPVTEETRFDVASVTKLFTSVAVLQQVAAGSLDLDASIAEHVDLSGTTISDRVTLRHLLTHTSGIADDADEEAGESYEALWRDRPNYAVTRTQDFLPQFAHKPPVFAPGEGCRYCNCGYVLAGLALEGATGTPYREQVEKSVFAPAGMTRSGFFDMRDAEPDVAEGWERDDAGRWQRNVYSYPPIGSPDGGAHCTAADLVRFLRAVRAGTLLPPDLTELFLSPQVLHHTRDSAEVHYGFGLSFLVADGVVRSMFKEGVNSGASAFVAHRPQHDVDFAIVSATEDGAWGPLTEINRVLVANS